LLPLSLGCLVLVIGDFRIVRQRLKLNPNHDEEMPKIRG